MNEENHVQVITNTTPHTIAYTKPLNFSAKVKAIKQIHAHKAKLDNKHNKVNLKLETLECDFASELLSFLLLLIINYSL